jgi:hypothetical protein
LRRAPPPFPGDDFISHRFIGMAPYKDRLDDSLLFDRIYQAQNFHLVEHSPGLEPSRVDKFNGNRFGKMTLASKFGISPLIVAQKRGESLA